MSKKTIDDSSHESKIRAIYEARRLCIDASNINKYHERQEFIADNKSSAEKIANELYTRIGESKIDDEDFLSIIKSVSDISVTFGLPISSKPVVGKITEAILNPKCGLSKCSILLHALTDFGFNANDHFVHQKKAITQCISAKIDAMIGRQLGLSEIKVMINILSNTKNILLWDESNREILQKAFDYMADFFIGKKTPYAELDPIKQRSLMYISSYYQAVCGVEIKAQFNELFRSLNSGDNKISNTQKKVFEALIKYLRKSEEWQASKPAKAQFGRDNIYGYLVQLEEAYVSEVRGDIVVNYPESSAKKGVAAVIEIDGPCHSVEIDGVICVNGCTMACNQMIQKMSKYFIAINVQDFDRCLDEAGIEQYFDRIGLSNLRESIYAESDHDVEGGEAKSATSLEDSGIGLSTKSVIAINAEEIATDAVAKICADGDAKPKTHKKASYKKAMAEESDSGLSDEKLLSIISRDAESIDDFLEERLLLHDDTISAKVVKKYAEHDSRLLFLLSKYKCAIDVHREVAKKYGYSNLCQNEIMAKLMQAVESEDRILVGFILHKIDFLHLHYQAASEAQKKFSDTRALHLTDAHYFQLLNHNCRDLKIITKIYDKLSTKNAEFRYEFLERTLKKGIIEADIEMVKWALERNPDLIHASIMIDIKKVMNGTETIIRTFYPLSLACMAGNGLDNIAMVKFLLEKGADINGLETMDMNPLCVACDAGNTKIVDYLLAQKSVNVNQYHIIAADDSELSPIKKFATKMLNREYVQYARETRENKAILAKKVINLQDTSLSMAIFRRNDEILAALIAAGADTNQSLFAKGLTVNLLEFALANGTPFASKILIDNGAIGAERAVIEPARKMGVLSRPGSGGIAIKEASSFAAGLFNGAPHYQ